MTVAAAVWSQAVGQVPWRVVAYERASKGGALYLKWRVPTKEGRTRRTNWAHVSLGYKLRDPHGRIMKENEKAAVEAATRKLADLITALPKAEAAARITIRQAISIVTDPKTGLYPNDGAHRREVLRALQYAVAIWGGERPWDTVRKRDLRELWRARISRIREAGKLGLRGAEVTIARILTVAEWLRGEELIPAGSCVAPRTWKQELRKDWREVSGSITDYTPARPRHTLEQMRNVLLAAAVVDPRFHLALQLGAELRLGQVIRARRTDLDLEKGEFTVRSRGGKRGTVSVLTSHQMVAVKEALSDGYLATLEAAGGDYPLFPQGQLRGGRSGSPRALEGHRGSQPVNRRTLQAWVKEAEGLAGVTHILGRGAYGFRRVSVDEAKKAGISREGLKALGGWTSTQIPDEVYADTEAVYARDEAKRTREQIRGEG